MQELDGNHPDSAEQHRCGTSDGVLPNGLTDRFSSDDRPMSISSPRAR